MQLPKHKGHKENDDRRILAPFELSFPGLPFVPLLIKVLLHR